MFLFRHGFNTAQSFGEKLQPVVTTIVKAIARRISGRELDGEPSEEGNTVRRVLSLALALLHYEQHESKGQGVYLQGSQSYLWLIRVVQTDIGLSIRRLRHSQATYLLKYLISIDRRRLNTDHGNGTGLRKCAEDGDLSYLRIRVTSICVSSSHTISRCGMSQHFGRPSLS
jgi:hypothetical protein